MAFTLVAATKKGGHAIIVVMQEENVRRMKQHDPMEFQAELLGFVNLKIDSVAVAYATDAEFEQYQEWGKQNRPDLVVEHIYSGWQFQPEKGDSDEPYELLNPTKTKKPQ